MSWHRAERPAGRSRPPARMPAFRRVLCACGCSTWFYARRRPGRPPAYLTPTHALGARRKRRQELA